MDKEKIVLITGAAGGIGSAAVAKFSQCGWKVIGVDRRDFEGPFPTVVYLSWLTSPNRKTFPPSMKKPVPFLLF